MPESELRVFLERFCELEDVNGSTELAEDIKELINDCEDYPILTAERFWTKINNYIRRV